MKAPANWKRITCLAILGVAIIYTSAVLRDWLRDVVPEHASLFDTVIELSVVVILVVFVALPIIRASVNRDNRNSSED